MCFARIQAPRSKLRGACCLIPTQCSTPLLLRQQPKPLNEIEFRNEFKTAFQFICIEKVAIVFIIPHVKFYSFLTQKVGIKRLRELGHFRMCIETYFRNSRGFRVLSVCRSI